jgi:hypothetical protein
MKKVASLVLGLSMCLLTPIVSAPCEQTYHVVANGNEYSIPVDGHALDDSSVSLLFVSEGKFTNAVDVVIEGPAGLQGVVEGGKIVDSSSAKQEPWPIVRAKEVYPIRAARSAREFERFLIDPESAGGIVYFSFLLHKDACDRERAPQYASWLRLDFGQVKPHVLSQGIVLKVTLVERSFAGSRVASIKPAADGKYRGEPILLMESLDYAREYVQVIQRSHRGHKSGAQFRKKLSIAKYVYYRGHTLALARLRGILRGGKATFELTNGATVHSACFDLVRRRQVAHGYPIS